MSQFVHKYEIDGKEIGESPCKEGVGQSPGGLGALPGGGRID